MLQVMETSQLLQELQDAMAEGAKAEKALEEAKAKLAPLESAAQNVRDKISTLMNQYQTAVNGAVPTATRRKRTMKPYNITPEAKVARAGKAAATRAKNAGKSPKEIKAAQAEAEASLKAKLGI